MIKYTLKLAGIPLEIKAMHDSTRDFCKEYLTEEAPLFSLSVTQSDIEKMHERDRLTAIAEGKVPVEHSDSYLETLALADIVLEKLIDYGIIMFHGLAMAVDGKAYLFSAKSGTGKTTHSKLWLDNIPDCHILNGDKPLLKFSGNGVFVFGSPWMGKEKYGRNEALPLAGVCILERDNRNHIEIISSNQCFEFMLGQCHVPSGGNNIRSVLHLVAQLSSVQFYRLGCNMENEAALVSYNAMVKNEI